MVEIKEAETSEDIYSYEKAAIIHLYTNASAYGLRFAG